MIVALCIVAYAALVVLHTGWLLAQLSDGDMGNKFYRENLGMCVFFALIPIFWLICPFLTGFYAHGFQLRRKPWPR